MNRTPALPRWFIELVEGSARRQLLSAHVEIVDFGPKRRRSDCLGSVGEGTSAVDDRFSSAKRLIQ